MERRRRLEAEEDEEEDAPTDDAGAGVLLTPAALLVAPMPSPFFAVPGATRLPTGEVREEEEATVDVGVVVRGLTNDDAPTASLLGVFTGVVSSIVPPPAVLLGVVGPTASTLPLGVLFAPAPPETPVDVAEAGRVTRRTCLRELRSDSVRRWEEEEDERVLVLLLVVVTFSPLSN